MTRACHCAALMAAGALLVGPLQAADDPVDPELLEFLGTVDSGAPDWRDYLASTDVDSVLQGRAAAANPPKPTKPAASDPQQEDPP